MNELKNIRNLNKIFLSYSGEGGSEIFSAYVPDGFGFDLKAKFQDMIGEGFGGKVITLASNMLLGIAPAFDIPRWFTYKGTDPISFSLKCSLLLHNDVKKDLVDPLLALVNLFLPSRNLEGSASDATKDWAVKIKEFASKAMNFISSDIAQSSDKIYVLNLPETMRPTSGKRLTLSYGPNGKMHFDDILISGIAVEIPMLTIEDGYPERIDISMTLETLRPATTDLMREFIIPPSR